MDASPAGGGRPQTVVIDASAWASRILPNDSNHQRAKAWIDTHIAGGGRFVAPQIIIIEVASAIRRQTGNPVDARKVINAIYALSIFQLVPVDQTLVDESAGLAADYGLRGADAMYVAIARRLGMALVTFDSYQLKQPASVVLTIQP